MPEFGSLEVIEVGPGGGVHYCILESTRSDGFGSAGLGKGIFPR